MSAYTQFIRQYEAQLREKGYKKQADTCPQCSERLWIRRTPIWSHDHSYQTGYTSNAVCVNCGWFEDYTDVE